MRRVLESKSAAPSLATFQGRSSSPMHVVGLCSHRASAFPPQQRCAMTCSRNAALAASHSCRACSTALHDSSKSATGGTARVRTTTASACNRAAMANCLPKSRLVAQHVCRAVADANFIHLTEPIVETWQLAGHREVAGQKQPTPTRKRSIRAEPTWAFRAS